MTRDLRTAGALVALAALVLDQGSKQWLLKVFDIAAHQPVKLGPFCDIVLAWNKGISYSLFTTDSAKGPWILLAVTLTATVLLALWLWRATSLATAIGLGMIVGGALGNAWDRFAYGAVVDFVYLHAGGFNWYIFNVADCAIVVGVIILLIDQLLTPSEAGKKG